MPRAAFVREERAWKKNLSVNTNKTQLPATFDRKFTMPSERAWVRVRQDGRFVARTLENTPFVRSRDGRLIARTLESGSQAQGRGLPCMFGMLPEDRTIEMPSDANSWRGWTRSN